MRKSRLLSNQLKPFQKAIVIAFLFIVFVLMILPLWNVFVISTSSTFYATSPGLKLWWQQFSFEGYKYVFSIVKLGRPIFNSSVTTITNTVLEVIFSALAGYVLVQNDLPFRKAIVSFIMITMMIPADLTMVSIYQFNKQIHLTNSYSGLIINGLVSGFNILLMRNYFLSVPISMSESARIDGGSEFRIFRSVYFPLALPGMATIFFLQFVAKWNDIMLTATLISDDIYYTLPLMLKQLILNQNAVSGVQAAPDNAIMATIVISMIPLIIVYIFAQQFLLAGMTVGANKE